MAGQAGGAAAFLLFLPAAALPAQLSSGFTLPLFFLFLSFRFLFQPRPRLLPGRGAGRPSSSQTPARHGSRCRLHLLEPGKLWSALGEAGVWGTLAPLPAILGPEPCLEMLGGTGDPEVKSRLHCPSRGTGSRAPPLPPVSWLLQLSQVPRPQPLPQDHQEHRGGWVASRGPLPSLAGRGAPGHSWTALPSPSHLSLPSLPRPPGCLRPFPFFFFPGCSIPSPSRRLWGRLWKPRILLVLTRNLGRGPVNKSVGVGAGGGARRPGAAGSQEGRL